MPPYARNFRPLPLTTWGGFSGQRRSSDSPHIESVWVGLASSDGVHLTAADGAVDLVFQTRRGVTRLLLSGPTSKAHTTTFKAGDKVLTIRLRTGIHLPFIASPSLTDIYRLLPNASSKHFWLQGSAITFPTFENVEEFIELLARTNLLQRDIVIEEALAEKPSRVGLRTMQRHFLASTGLTMNHIRQIRRAEQARHLLSSDRTLTAIAYETGYSNPGHMTNAFKYFFGRTPSDLRLLMIGSH